MFSQRAMAVLLVPFTIDLDKIQAFQSELERFGARINVMERGEGVVMVG